MVDRLTIVLDETTKTSFKKLFFGESLINGFDLIPYCIRQRVLICELLVALLSLKNLAPNVVTLWIVLMVWLFVSGSTLVETSPYLLSSPSHYICFFL